MITFFKKTINYHYDNENVENLDQLILDQLIHKIHNNDINAVENIIENQANILNLQDNDGETALMRAIQTKNKELVELILSKNPNVNIRDNDGMTALMWAIKTENKELVELILSKNPNVNIRDNDTRTAFYYAKSSSNEEIKKLFNEDSEIYKANQAFENLIDKIYDNDTDAAKNIIQKHANNILNLQDENGMTALMIFIIRENKELVELILLKNPNVNIRDNYGETALMLAIRSENKDLVELILSKNPDVNLQDNDGKTALMLAIQTRKKELVELILSKGADVNIRDNFRRTARGNSRRTAFDYADISAINLQELIDKVKSSKGN